MLLNAVGLYVAAWLWLWLFLLWFVLVRFTLVYQHAFSYAHKHAKMYFCLKLSSIENAYAYALLCRYTIISFSVHQFKQQICKNYTWDTIVSYLNIWHYYVRIFIRILISFSFLPRFLLFLEHCSPDPHSLHDFPFRNGGKKEFMSLM